MEDAMIEAHDRVGPVGDVQLHDLRNRLTVVKGVAQLLDRQVRRDDWEREKIIARVDKLQDEIARLEQLIDDYESDGGADGSGKRADLLH